MKRGQCGYTIIEVILFLGISTALFTMMTALINGEQGKSEFTHAVRDVETVVQDVINDVDTGYFPSVGAASDCGGTNSGQQGSNTDCIFAGKAFQFAPVGYPADFVIYTLYGKRLNGTEDVKSLVEADPKPLNNPGNIERKTLSDGLEFTRIIHGSDKGGFAIIPNFAQTFGSDVAAVSNSTGNAGLYAVNGTGINSSTNDYMAHLNSVDISPYNQRLTICMREQGGGRRASLSFGGQGGASVSTKFDSDALSEGCP